MPIGVNLRSKVVTDCRLTMRPFHPPSPQPPPAPPQGGSIRGGQEILLRPPYQGGFRGLETRLKARFINGFGLKLTPMGNAVSLQYYFGVGKRHYRVLGC